MMKRFFMLSATAATLLAFQNCGGGFNGGQAELSSLEAPPPPSVSNNAFNCVAGTDPVQTELLKLTNDQYERTLLDLFPDLTASAIKDYIALLPDEGPTDTPVIRPFDSQNMPVPSVRSMSGYQRVAEQVANIAANSAPRLDKVGTSCLRAANVTAVCIKNFITNFGLKVYRRPLEASEIAMYESVYAQGTTYQERASLVLQVMLQSPYFIYRLEPNGTPVSGRANVYKIDPYAVASRLSYYIIGTMPDKALFDAAAANQLSTSAEIQAQTERLFALPRAKENLRLFYQQWLGTRDIPLISKTIAANNGFIYDDLAAESRQEIIDFMEYIIWTKQGNYRDIMTSDMVIAKGPQLAKVYGVTASSTAQPGGPDRHGLLTRVGMLSRSDTGSTRPIIRGVATRIRMLCEDLPPPPDNVDDFAVTPDPLASTRDQVKTTTSPTMCMGCHQRINPLGFAFEKYDGFGRLRVSETVTDGSTTRIHNIDAQIVPEISSKSEQMVDGAVPLQLAMADDPKGAACFTQQYSRFLVGRDLDVGDSCGMNKMYTELTQQGGSILNMMKARTASPDFLYRKSE